MCVSRVEVADLAHMVGASVEGELGCLGSLETGHGEAEDGHGFEGKLDKSMLLTDPDEALRFVAETKVDALAVAIGTSHGAYKFTRKPTGDVLAMERDRGDPREAAEYAHRHARFLIGA
jgi:fructose-bisphosphate aldolase class II